MFLYGECDIQRNCMMPRRSILRQVKFVCDEYIPCWITSTNSFWWHAGDDLTWNQIELNPSLNALIVDVTWISNSYGQVAIRKHLCTILLTISLKEICRFTIPMCWFIPRSIRSQNRHTIRNISMLLIGLVALYCVVSIRWHLNKRFHRCKSLHTWWVGPIIIVRIHSLTCTWSESNDI